MQNSQQKPHVLDNPAWNALTTGNSNLAAGNGPVLIFPADVSPFVGLEEATPDNFKLLYELVPAERSVGLVTAVEIEIPGDWEVVTHMKLLQMVWMEPLKPLPSDVSLVLLNDSHRPQMLALTALTNPGPFYENTNKFGGYSGIFDGDNLVAMAGYRMNPGGYREVSAVCTHPDYLGRGYAGMVIRHVANTISSRGETPFLHVRPNNTGALGLYHKLGFAVRHEMTLNIIKKK